jgi:hypothetical protein
MIEVDVIETLDGKLVLRSHGGAIVLAPNGVTQSLTTRPSKQGA